MEPLYKIWINLWTPLSWPFTVVVLVMMVWDLASYYVNEGRNHRQFTGLMTGVGILGTFFGVVVGLQDFDPKNIAGSIAPLLEGLKTSFATSVAGICAAILTEGAQIAAPSRRGKTGDPVADVLNKNLLELTDLMDSAKRANVSVAENVAGLRTEMRDESAKVRLALEAALKELAQGASKEIISALERVISDFNNNLKEQFGENFNRLNEACLKMVEWQESYEDAVTACNQALLEAKNAMAGAREQLEAVVPQKERFYEIVEKTGLTMEVMAKLNQRLEQMSGTLGDVLVRFADSLTNVDQKALQMRDTFNGTVTTVAAEHSTAMKGITNLVQTAEMTRSKIEQMLADHARGHKAVADGVDAVITRLGNGSRETEKHLEKALSELENTLASLTREFGGAYRSYLDALRKLTSRAD